MAKEQLAVAELIMNLILGKTENVSRVDFFRKRKNSRRIYPMNSLFQEQPRKVRVYLPACSVL